MGLIMAGSLQALQGKVLVSVQRALDKKIITAKATCAGGLSVNYNISNLSKDSVCLMLPAGWRFNSDAGKSDYQDILVAHDQLLVLKPKENKTFKINGYCCEATKHGPFEGIRYTVGKIADTSLVKVAVFLNAHPADKNVEQYAVWAISDNKPAAQITGQYDSIAMVVREFVAAMKHEPLPWYTLLKQMHIGSDGVVQEYPVKLRARLDYDVPAAEYSYFYILDESGRKVGQIKEQWLTPGGKAYLVSLDVKSFAPGSYKLVLETKDAKLVEKQFEI